MIKLLAIEDKPYEFQLDSPSFGATAGFKDFVLFPGADFASIISQCNGPFPAPDGARLVELGQQNIRVIVSKKRFLSLLFLVSSIFSSWMNHIYPSRTRFACTESPQAEISIGRFRHQKVGHEIDES
jgi:hypothetical protein